MSELVKSKEKKFTSLELKPRRLIRVHYTPNKGRDYHTLSFYDEYGKRQRRMFPDRSIAEAEAAKLRRKIDNGVLPGLLLNGRERLIYERALETARTTGLDLDTLTKDAAEARAVLRTVSLTDAARFYVDYQAKLITKTVSEVVAELVEDRVKNDKSPLYVRDLKKRLGDFAGVFKCPISSVDWKDIEKYLDGIGGKGRYRKNLISTIGTLFNFAKIRNYVHRDHPGVSPITRPAVVPREVRVLTSSDCYKLLAGLPPKLIPSAAIGLFTPIRSTEIDRMDWSRVNLREGHIEISARTAKKKIRRIVPIPANLNAWLRPFVKPCGKVCPFLKISDNWNQVAARAGVQWSRNVHRDSAISYTVALTKNVPEVALVAGNSPQVIVSNYLKCVTEAEAKKWFSIRPPKGWKPK
jgi:hypothetical protein